MPQSPKVATRRRLKKFSGGPAYPPRQYAKNAAGPNAMSADGIAALFRWMRGVPQEVAEPLVRPQERKGDS